MPTDEKNGTFDFNDLLKKAISDNRLSYSAIGALTHLVFDFKQKSFTGADLLQTPHQNREEFEKALAELVKYNYLEINWSLAEPKELKPFRSRSF